MPKELSKANHPSLAEELADVIIYVDLTAGHLCIDLEKAIVHKFNQKTVYCTRKTLTEAVLNHLASDKVELETNL